MPCGKTLLDHVKLRLEHPGAEKAWIDEVDAAGSVRINGVRCFNNASGKAETTPVFAIREG